MSIVSAAYVFRGVERGLELEEIVVTAPGPGEVLLRVEACGACHSDVHKLEGRGNVATPCIFGHEISATITSVGDGVTRVAPGDRVVCSFLVPCGECAQCVRGDDEDCVNYRSRMQSRGLGARGQVRYQTEEGEVVLGSGVAGLVRDLVLPATGVFRLPDGWPDDIPLADAAILGCAAFTAYGAAVRSAKFHAGMTALVCAAGGVGLCLVRLLRHLGATEVIVSDIRPDALAAARDAGATAVALAGSDELNELVAERTVGGVDVAFDTLGHTSTLTQSLDAVADGGSIVITGLGSAGVEVQNLPSLVRRRIKIVGSYAAKPSVDMPDLLDIVVEGGLNPTALISERYSFAQAAEAYSALQDGRVVGRALIDFTL